MAHYAWKALAELSCAKCARLRVLSIAINARTISPLTSIQASATASYVMWSTVNSAGLTVQIYASNAYQRFSSIGLQESVSSAKLERSTMKPKDNA